MEKILTEELVKELGLDKLEVITSDMFDGYTSIGGYAFGRCNSITSITLPNSVTSIGYMAFYNCSSLTSITIGNSVTSIGDGAFDGCTSLTSIVWNAKTCGGWSFSSYAPFSNIRANITSFSFGEEVETIPSYLCYGMSSLTSITLPNSVTSIGGNAFDCCSSLTSITIPNSIKSIEKYAFFYCNKLKNVVIGDKVYKKHKIIKNKCKAYKAFNADMTCRGFQYEEGKTYEIDGEPELCKCGFHACLRLTDVFTHYHGEIGKDIVVYEVELEGVSDERQCDSKVVAKKITIGKRIL